MSKTSEYSIQFNGLKEGKHYFNFQLTNDFFIKEFDYQEFNSAVFAIQVLLNKKSNMLELDFNVEGEIGVYCDVSNEPYIQPISGKMEIVVKFGEEFNDEGEFLILPRGVFEIEVKHYLYEAAVLSVPYKKVHPQVLDGTMDSAILDKLEELAPKNKESDEIETDPRWDDLKKLLNEK